MPLDLTDYIEPDGGLFPPTAGGDHEHIVYRPDRPYVILSGAFTVGDLRLIADYIETHTQQETA